MEWLVETGKAKVAWQQGLRPEGIVTIGDPLLRKKAEQVADFSAAAALADQMIAKLRDLGGAGLAAPQVGSSLRLAIVEVRRTELFPDRPESPLYVLVNPAVTPLSNEMDDGWEGCFSIPGMMGIVPRFRSITLRYQGLDTAWHEERMDGYVARVVQHECDHLEGVLFFDRMHSPESLTTIENYKNFYHKK